MLIVMCMIGLVASGAWAYPGPDSFGIYWGTEEDPGDEIVGAVEICVDAAAFSQLDLYLCITGLSTSQVAGWEAQVEIVPDADSGAFFGSWTLVAGLNVGSGINYQVGIGDGPLPPNAHNVVTVMTMAMAVIDDTAPIEFYIRGVPGSLSFPPDGLGYAPDVGLEISCLSSTGGPTTPVFIVNPDEGSELCPIVGNEDATWGHVKTLYK